MRRAVNNAFIGSIALILFSLLGIPPAAYAQNQILFGGYQSYSVVFRGNGEAIVNARIVISNPSDKPISNLSFEIPKVTPYELALLQQILPRQCTNYSYANGQQVCSQYSDPDYGNSYTNYGYYYQNQPQTQYEKVSYTQSGSGYVLTLPQPIMPYKSGAVIVSFAAKGYVSSFLGLYSFEFETIKVPYRIHDLRVAIDVDSELYLAGKQSQVNYSQPATGNAMPAAPLTSLSGKQLDTAVSSIGTTGPIIKEAKELAPYDSYVAKGEYADSWFRLYLSSFLWALSIIAAVFVFGIYAVKRWRKKRAAASVPGSVAAGEPSARPDFISLSIAAVGLGFLSATLAVGLTYLLRYLSSLGVWNQYFGYYNDPIIGLVVFLVVALLYVLVIFGPSILAGAKLGWKACLAVLFCELVWYIIFLIIYVAFFSYHPVYPYNPY